MAELLTENQIIALVKRHSDGPKGKMNRALLVGCVSWGMHLVEITDLDIRHVLEPSGKLRKSFEITKELSYNGFRRSMDTLQPKLIQLLIEYLQELAEAGDPDGIEGEYLELNPSRPLFTNKAGKRFNISKRGNGRGTASGMRAYIQDLIKRSDLAGGGYTPSSFRRTWIIQHARSGMKPVDLMHAAGIRSISTLNRIIYEDPERVKQKLTGLYSRL